MEKLGNIALLVNPAAQNGNGAKEAQEVYAHLVEACGHENVTLVQTARPRHAVELASSLDVGFDTLICLGGDGLVHEVVNGIMSRPADQRPVLGVIPYGSGNDYAASLNMPTKACDAVEALLRGNAKTVDVGKVNEEYFAETLSFGLDAAIALGTEERRKRTGKKGNILYLEEGLDQIIHHFDFHPFEYSCAEREGQGRCIMFAVQVGPTYGGGFKICPNAKLDDGLLDVCFARGPVPVPKGLYIFLKAKDGKHLKYKEVELFNTKQLTLSFGDDIACQVDGEAYNSEVYSISIVEKAFTVLVGEQPN